MSRRTPEPDAAGVAEDEADGRRVVTRTDSARATSRSRESGAVVEAERLPSRSRPPRRTPRRRCAPAVGRLQGRPRPGAARAADPALRAAGEVRRRPGRRGPAAEHRAGRPGLLRHLRSDRRDREVRPRARDQVRDLRDQPDPRRDHRRAARHRLDPALGPLQGPRGREGLRPARGRAAPHADRARGRRGDGHRADRPARDLQPGLLRQRRGARRAAQRRRREGRQAHASSTPSRTPRPRTRSRRSSPRRPSTSSPGPSTRCPSGRRSSSPSTTTRA